MGFVNNLDATLKGKIAHPLNTMTEKDQELKSDGSLLENQDNPPQHAGMTREKLRSNRNDPRKIAFHAKKYVPCIRLSFGDAKGDFITFYGCDTEASGFNLPALLL